MKQTLGLTQVNPAYWIYTIYSPLYGETCTIRDTIIQGAILQNATILVRLRVGKELWIEELVNPSKWKSESKIIEMYHSRNTPMRMYKREVVSNQEPGAFCDLESVKNTIKNSLRDEELYA